MSEASTAPRPRQPNGAIAHTGPVPLWASALLPPGKPGCPRPSLPRPCPYEPRDAAGSRELPCALGSGLSCLCRRFREARSRPSSVQTEPSGACTPRAAGADPCNPPGMCLPPIMLMGCSGQRGLLLGGLNLAPSTCPRGKCTPAPACPQPLWAEGGGGHMLTLWLKRSQN